MKHRYHVWYVALAVLAIAPIGLRMLTWSIPRVPAADAPMAEAGHKLFLHEWRPNDPLCPGGDGLGPVYNDTSCVACHNQGGAGGGGGLEHNITTFAVESPDRAPPLEGVLHAYAVQSRDTETLKDVNMGLPAIWRPRLAQLLAAPRVAGVPIASWPKNAATLRGVKGVHLSQRNSPALFGAGLIDGIPDATIIAGERKQHLHWGLASANSTDLPVGRASRLPDGRIGHFGWKAQTATLAQFVRAACANELGLSNPSKKQPVPLGKSNTASSGLDLSAEQCDQLTAFVTTLSRPQERLPALPDPDARIVTGKHQFQKVGCADRHTPDLGSVSGLYSDLLLHRMGADLEVVGTGSYDTPSPSLPPPSSPGEKSITDEWRTPPLWGVADSAPYLHDGRAATLEEAIQLHGGQATRSVQRYQQLSSHEQSQLIEFLKTLRAP